TVRQIARSSEGFSWLMWLSEQPLKNAPDGQPYKKDVALRAVLQQMADAEEDQVRKDLLNDCVTAIRRMPYANYR
ncbi:MAG: hypothetical protein EBR82_62000, partial [Caulobacteraceae bacterium]|nr:hypothetical protein [Caulobacteraceae bacterium]